jgi:hypothetical protein
MDGAAAADVSIIECTCVRDGTLIVSPTGMTKNLCAGTPDRFKAAFNALGGSSSASSVN